MFALLASIILGAPTWAPREIAMVERYQTRTVVRWGVLSSSTASTLTFKEGKVFVLTGLSAGNVFGDFTRVSPNGRVLGVTGVKDGKPTLALAKADGSISIREIASPVQFEWSPASDKLAILSYNGGGRRTSVDLLELRSNRKRVVSQGSYRIAWSRDGKRLLSASRVRRAQEVPFDELLRRGLGVPDPSGEATVVSSFDPTSRREQVVDIGQATQWVLGDPMAQDALRSASRLLWSPLTSGMLWLSPRGALVVSALPVQRSVSFDVLLTEKGRHLIPQRYPNPLGAIYVSVLDSRSVGYASGGTLFEGQTIPSIDGLRLTLYDVVLRRPRTWVVNNRRADECAVYWTKPR